MKHEACVIIQSRYLPRRVDALGAGAYRARDIERGDGSVASPQEAVRHQACVFVESRDLPRWVDASGAGVYRARGIERDKGGLRRSKGVLLKFRTPSLVPPETLGARIPSSKIELMAAASSRANAKSTPTLRNVFGRIFVFIRCPSYTWVLLLFEKPRSRSGPRGFTHGGLDGWGFRFPGCCAGRVSAVKPNMARSFASARDRDVRAQGRFQRMVSFFVFLGNPVLTFRI